MREEEIKALFPEGVETLTITKNDYDRLYGQMTYENIILRQENQELRDEIVELQEYKKAVYEIKKYIDAYSPYFLETQEQNNQTIATIIHNIGDDSDD